MCVAVSLQCCGQLQIKDKDFSKFVGKFSTEDFPINTKQLKKVFNVNNDKSNVTKAEAIKFLGRTEDSMTYFFELYDYDEDMIKGYEKKECIPGVVCKYYTEKFISLVTIEGKISSDTTLMYLYTFNYNGKMIDQCVIGEQFTREDDWVGCIFENELHFKLFWYSANFCNNEQQDSVDNEKPLTKVIIESYEISSLGKIQKKNVSKPIFLKEYVLEYKSYNADNDDDPMNEY